jgi:hypothetical protein
LQIFLSYASEDKDLAEPIAFSLRARGHDVFFDRDDLPAGDEYDMRIEKAVERSALFIFLLSPAAVEKGRFTLTELEFARRKWRNADGHVLPVMARPVTFDQIPNFLKSVTVLEPQGNLAAEVAAAVAPLSQSVAGGQMLVYGALGVVSGLLTWRLYKAFGAILTPARLNFSVHDVELALDLAGIAFGLALVAGFAYYFRFQPRQLAIIPFVLAGWFLATQTAVTFGMTSKGEIPQGVQCANMKDDEKADVALANECVQYWRFRFEETGHVQQDIVVWFAAGAVGALATALGVPVATRRNFSPVAALLAIIAGAIVAAAWFVTIWWTGPYQTDAMWTYLFVAWQGVVAAVVGRSIR